MALDNITERLAEQRAGAPQGDDPLYRNIYGELRIIAQSHRRRWIGNDTLNTTSLIHEAYVKLAESKDTFQNRTHFYATASKAIRQVLVNYAERNKADKRRGHLTDLKLDELVAGSNMPLEQLLDIDQLLKQLERQSPRRCRIVECRVFGGMSIQETAQALNVSPATVKRDWVLVSAWLYCELHSQQ